MALEPDSTASNDATPRSRWARVLEDGDEPAREALRDLAASYWYCAYAWWRRTGLDAGKAATATVGSFTRWLTDAPPQRADSGAARLREWLPARLAELSALNVERWTLKVERSPEAAIEIAPDWAEARYAQEPAGEADAIFQRRWALTVLEFSVEAVRAEYTARGQDALFAEAVSFAGFEGGDDAHYQAAASRAGLSTGAMRKAVFDFRTRQRELLRGIVGDTLADPADLDSEITALLCACDAPGNEAAGAPLPTALGAMRPDEVLARLARSVRMTSGGGAWRPPTIEEVARLFPGYTIESLLGRGGMGAVYKARQTALDRPVAIKLLPLEISVDRDFAARFVREARTMARLNHPHILTVHDFGQTAEGHLYFVMEYVEGANLHEVIHSSPITDHHSLSPARALEIIGAVCDALEYAHGEGVIHRDIKPANVLLDKRGRVKVADFGLARLARLTSAPATDLGHTVTGTVMGTPDYMAPEQTRGMNVDHRADIYALGVMLYELLCREVPRGIFDPPSTRTGCDPRIDQIVVKAMHSAPERRYQSVTEMKTDLETARTAKVALPAAPALRAKGADEASHSGSPHRHDSAPPQPNRTRRWIGMAVGALLIAAMALILQERNTGGSLGPTPLRGGAAASAQTIDLLALIDPVVDRVMPGSLGLANQWEKTDGILRYQSDGRSGKITAPVAIAASRYEFDLTFTRLGGVSQLNVDLPIAPGKIVPIALLAPGVKLVSGAAGPAWPAGQPDRGRLLLRYEAGQPAHLIVQLDGRPIADMYEDLERWQKPADPHASFPGQALPSLFCMRDSFEITAWTLRVFEGEAKVLRRPAANPATATKDAPITGGPTGGQRVLFDGTTLAGWRSAKSEALPPGWAALDGALAAGGQRGCILTREEFSDFELELEWRVSADGNGGVFFRVEPGFDRDYPVAAPQLQLCAPNRDRDTKPGLIYYPSGSLYELVPAREDASLPVGQWNTARIVARGNQCEHWINGRLVCSYDLTSPELARYVAASSHFKGVTGIGLRRRGHIALECYTGEVAYRKVRIRSLALESASPIHETR